MDGTALRAFVLLMAMFEVSKKHLPKLKKPNCSERRSFLNTHTLERVKNIYIDRLNSTYVICTYSWGKRWNCSNTIMIGGIDKNISYVLNARKTGGTVVTKGVILWWYHARLPSIRRRDDWAKPVSEFDRNSVVYRKNMLCRRRCFCSRGNGRSWDCSVTIDYRRTSKNNFVR